MKLTYEDQEYDEIRSENKKYFRLLKLYISYKNIKQKKIEKSTGISQSNLSKILNGHNLSKNLYFKILSKLQEHFEPDKFIKQLIDDYLKPDPILENKIKNIEKIHSNIAKKSK
ncbi:MAG: helix-turn-helix domain-containing protein [Syntrophales bacterium]|nr:helix-turn-helix domain-containing protein [Syntrophales bacterium]